VQREKSTVVALVKDPTGVAALYLGKQEGNELRYMGKVWAEAGRNRRRSARRLIRS
jgi:bifunctional non-homologous end joining protein LigD